MPDSTQSLPENRSSGAAEGRISHDPARRDVICRTCGADSIIRVERRGLRDRWILPLAGYFPWRCLICRKKVYLRARSRRTPMPARLPLS